MCTQAKAICFVCKACATNNIPASFAGEKGGETDGAKWRCNAGDMPHLHEGLKDVQLCDVIPQWGGEGLPCLYRTVLFAPVQMMVSAMTLLWSYQLISVYTGHHVLTHLGAK